MQTHVSVSTCCVRKPGTYFHKTCTNGLYSIKHDTDTTMIWSWSVFLSVCISSIIALSRISFIWSKITSFKKVKIVSNCGRFRSNLTILKFFNSITVLQEYLYLLCTVSYMYCILYGFHRKAHALPFNF